MIDDAPTIGRACALLVVVIDELRGLRSDLAGRKAAKNPRVLSADDVRVLLPLLPAIAAAMGDETFTVHHLTAAAQGRTRAAKTLRAALDATGMNPLQIGRLLRRAAESEMQIAGFHAHRIGPSREGAMFCVDAKSREHHLASGIAQALHGRLQS
ncbi:MAG: hypothetical protein HY661_02460 [Betaproteobacteria bacterium]|nr:hypothetical protein [Betaproteobacteria bacterium]